MQIILPLIVLAILIPFLWKPFGSSVLTLLGGAIVFMMSLFTGKAVFLYLGIACMVIGFPLHLSHVFAKKREEQSDRGDQRQKGSAPGTRRCPNCGSPAAIRGSRWECGYCGDSGYIK